MATREPAATQVRALGRDVPTEKSLMRHALTPGEGLNLLLERAITGDATAHACHTALLPLLTYVAEHRCALEDLDRLTAENERMRRHIARLIERVQRLEEHNEHQAVA